MDWTRVRGFNYQPSYGTSGLELWLRFNADTIRSELGQGKALFPRFNTVRWWLSWDAFLRDPHLFAAHFETALSIADELDLLVMPVLFNRWHTMALDYGGIYIDHLLSQSVRAKGKMFAPFMRAVVADHADDPRIFAWDLCNEPFSYLCQIEQIPDIVAAEFRWLESLYQACKQLNAAAPVTVGIHAQHGRQGIEQVEPISDLLSIHPYYTGSDQPQEKKAFESLLDVYVAFAQEAGKPLLATETCWGSLDDMKRAEIIRYTLGELAKRNIGWLAYLLHHSLIADAHRPEFGPVDSPGNLSFIEADGSLRPGHDVFNEF